MQTLGPMQTLGRIAVRVKVLEPGDSLGKAADAVRASTVGAVPVLDGGMLLGLVTGDTLTRFLTEREPVQPDRWSVADLELEAAHPMPEDLRAPDALRFFQANDVHVAPVVDYGGGLVGVVSRAELASAACGRVKPPLIGGMATPFGVYLTGGGVRGGVGDLALVSTGVFTALVVVASLAITQFVLAPPAWAGPFVAFGHWADTWNGTAQRLFANLLMAGVFGLIFRLSPLTGYHAAEHQAVHTVEAGDDLRPDVVASKPRVHPRCGTNIVAAVTIVTLFWRAPGLGDAAPVLALATMFFTWRRIGGILQQYVTTRPASPKQIKSGIAAAAQLLDRYQSGPPTRLTFGRRVWNMGLLQVLLGYLMVYVPLWLLLALCGIHIPLDV